MKLTALVSAPVDIGCIWKYEAEILSSRRRGSSICRVRGSLASAPQTSQSVKVSVKRELENAVRIGVLGASGYTGSEVVRLLANHPHFCITLLTADRKAGQPIGSVFPHLITQDLPDLVTVQDADFSSVDAVFCCLPHGTTQEIIKALPTELKIVDLSADFRLRDVHEYEKWYGQPHKAPTLQIDNLVKGASGQAVQNLNLMMGFPESMGLQQQPLFP